MKEKVLVTGASGNLGSAIVRKLMSEGYPVLGTVTSERSQNRLKEQGVESVVLDLTSQEAVEAFVEEKGSDIDVVIMTVGGFAPGKLNDTKLSAIQDMMTINFNTSYILTQSLLSTFEAKGKGRIIYIGSRPGISVDEAVDTVAYAFSKNAVFFLSDLVNNYDPEKRISATVLVPSIIDTPRNREAFPNADYSTWVTSEAIADTTEFLLTETGRQVSQEVITIYNKS